jgi:hypothetical protein
VINPKASSPIADGSGTGVIVISLTPASWRGPRTGADHLVLYHVIHLERSRRRIHTFAARWRKHPCA